MSKIGVIGGSGLYDMEGLSLLGAKTVVTPFGEPSAAYRIGSFEGAEIVFLPRHGVPHSIPPHRVNYRANLFGFKELGVRQIVAVSATGGIAPDCKPGALVLLDQVLDLTSGRKATYYDGPEVVHVDFTHPYCPEMRNTILNAAAAADVTIRPTGTYLCTNGPRLESAAEIRHFASQGADVVGMTGMPETVLARELEICYAGIAVVTNPAAGLSSEKLTTTEVVNTMRTVTHRLASLLSAAFSQLLSRDFSCPCPTALDQARL